MGSIMDRLTARAVSDGRSYTYAWSDRGELLAETTQGVDVRTFEWDAAGRLVEATVFTLTTHFTYTGDGVRVALEVAGVGVTAYIPDRGRILLESTATTSTRYLYGRDCLGEVRAGTLLYYLADGRGYVRQATDEDGAVVDAWLFTPDGGVMAGPLGPVSHLVCGGVYDWSTGLLYSGGRYFDPTLGLWLTLGPLVVIQGWRVSISARHGATRFETAQLSLTVAPILTRPRLRQPASLPLAACALESNAKRLQRFGWRLLSACTPLRPALRQSSPSCVS